jgi:hypothetical protein
MLREDLSIANCFDAEKAAEAFDNDGLPPRVAFLLCLSSGQFPKVDRESWFLNTTYLSPANAVNTFLLALHGVCKTECLPIGYHKCGSLFTKTMLRT